MARNITPVTRYLPTNTPMAHPETGLVNPVWRDHLSGPALKGVTVILDDEDIRKLPTTPFLVLPAPPPGFRIKLFGATYLLDTTAGAYTNVNATYCASWIGTPTQACTSYLVTDSSVSATQAANFYGAGLIRVVDAIVPALVAVDAAALGVGEWVLANAPTIPGDTKANWNAAPLTFQVDNNGSMEFTGGDPANFMKVTLYYVQEAL